MSVVINGIDIAFDDQGGDGAPVVLLHGFPLCRRMWRPQVDALTAVGYRVITLDLRGFGESGVAAPGGMDPYADDVVGLLDHLGIERAAVGGMSMGGYVLFNLLERHRRRIASALFIVTRAAADDEPARMKRSDFASEVARGNASVVADAFEGILFVPSTPEDRPELVAEVRAWMSATPPDGLIAGLLAMRDRPDYTAKLGRFDLPSLVIGAEQDRAVPPEHARVLAEGLPQSELCLLSGAGHMVNLEQPEVFNESVLPFLRRHWPA